MAKRTKIKAAEAVVITNTPVIPTTTVATPEVVVNSSNKVETNVTCEAPSKSSELEQFTVIKDNIIKADDYIKFTELAVKYNLFNKLDLNNLCKQDLVCLIGFGINGIYQLRDELNKIKQEEMKKKQTSFDKPVNYSDLLTVGEYKSWN